MSTLPIPPFGMDPASQQIESLAKMLTLAPYTIEGKWYHHQTLNIDGYRFINCRFDNCTIYLSKGNFVFDRCYFAGGLYYFKGEALNVANIVSLLIPEGMMASSPKLAAKVNDDGTISIGTA